MSRKEEGNGYHRRLLVEARRDVLNSQMFVTTGAARFPLAVPDFISGSLCIKCKFYDRCKTDVFVREPRPVMLPCEIDSPAHAEWKRQSGLLGRFETRP